MAPGHWMRLFHSYEMGRKKLVANTGVHKQLRMQWLSDDLRVSRCRNIARIPSYQKCALLANLRVILLNLSLSESARTLAV